MAKKRKASAAPNKTESAPDTQDRRVRMQVTSYEDVAGSDDEFMINRDKISLGEGPDAKRRRQWHEQDEFLEQPDEEVLAHSDTPDEDDLQASSTSDDDAAPENSDQDEGRWGDSKRDYYDADVIETEQDALDEENEARRIQQKRLQAMTAADFGYDEQDWKAPDDTTTKSANVVTEVLPQLQLTKDMTPAHMIQLLKSRYPEFEHLSAELVTLQTELDRLPPISNSIASLPSTRNIKRNAAVTYLGALTMYFALLTSTADVSDTDCVALAPTVLRAHPVMDSLLACRNLWLEVKSLPEDSDESMSDEDESATMVKDAELDAVTKTTNGKTRRRKSGAQQTADKARARAEELQAKRVRDTEASLADLDDLLTRPSTAPKWSKTSKQQQHEQSDSDFEDETGALDAKALAAKASKRKSLRFYTSQIAQTANRRGEAGRNAGGDDDVPHRERLRDRQERLQTLAEKRGASAPSRHEQLDSEDSGASEAETARAVRGEDGRAPQGEEYYNLIAGQTAAKKADRRALAAARAEAETLPGAVVVPTETIGPDGKRAIGYAIEKNKGLMTLARGGKNKKKDISNPRVKKRVKYEEKKKKLASMKPVYKGGEGRGGYKGELTGIKSNVVRSTKL